MILLLAGTTKTTATITADMTLGKKYAKQRALFIIRMILVQFNVTRKGRRK